MKSRRAVSVLRSGLAALVLVLAAFVAAPARAWPGPDLWYTPWLSPARLQQCLAALALEDQDQEAVIRALYSDLLRSYEAQSRPVKLAMEEVVRASAEWQAAHPGQDAWTLEGEDFGHHDVQSRWRRQRRELEEDFASDVRDVLDAVRRTIWTRTLAMLRRERVLPELKTGTGHRTIPDLVSILSELPLTSGERQSADEDARGYADELDEVLRRWEASVDDIFRQIFARAGNMSHATTPQNAAEIEQLHGRLTEMDAKAREITTRHADALAGRFGEEARVRFLLEINRVIYPNVYRDSPVDLVVDALRRCAAVDPQALEAAESIYREYVPERDANRQRILEAIRSWEDPVRARLRGARWQLMRENGEDPMMLLQEHPVIEHLYRRRELDLAACERMRTLFSQEGFDALPLAIQILLSWQRQ